ncbi:MAG: sigma 54-interacting transcriptional regulator [Limisphaerales bacterium]
MKAIDLDLAELMQFAPGRVALHGRRLILHDLKSLGLFRRDLIEMMGEAQARRILTRKGYFWGQTDAAEMRRLFRWDNPGEWLQAWPMLLRLTGLAECELTVPQLDLDRGTAEFRVTWSNSSETEQHLTELGRSEHPICWVLVGYASGYASHCLGKSVYFLEHECQAAGAGECVAVGRDAGSWGPEIEPHVAFFHAVDIQQRVAQLTRQIEQHERELARHRSAAAQPVAHEFPVDARSPAFQRVMELAGRVARFDTTVLITGETGSGKERLAHHLHQCSPRAGKPFLAINCSAMPEALLESELFGHRAGAFTGATRAHRGLFEEAHEGTLFLDEIGDIPAAMQVKLLRVLQEREVRPVGESKSRPVDVRVLSATNRDLEELVAEGRFRQDLFYRLNVVPLRVPPLRERREDILPLARHFLHRAVTRHKLPARRFGPACVDAFLNHAWPGNVRELENAVEHAAVLCPGEEITPDLLPIRAARPREMKLAAGALESLETVELEHIRAVLEQVSGNRAEAARVLRIGEATLYRKLRKLTPGAAS